MSAATPNRRIRVVHLTHGLGMGGLEKLLVEFARHADRNRFELTFLSFGGRGALADDIEALGWPVVTLNQPEGLRPLAVLQIAKLLRRWQADVLHTHDPKSLIYGAPAAWLARVAYAMHTSHGKAISPHSRAALAFRTAFRFADAMVCVSQGTLQQMLEMGIEPGKISVILNGIDTSVFGFAGPKPGGCAVTVARLNPVKDIATLIRAIPIIMQDCPTFRLEIAGEGPCLESLANLVRELKVDSKVVFLGHVQDVRTVLQRAAVLVLPSLTEGVSLTLLEAMACGIPVVTTRVGGNPEVVDDGKTGLLVPPGSPDELASAIISLLQDSEKSRQMGMAGCQRVSRLFDIRRMVADYETIYAKNVE